MTDYYEDEEIEDLDEEDIDEEEPQIVRRPKQDRRKSLRVASAKSPKPVVKKVKKSTAEDPVKVSENKTQRLYSVDGKLLHVKVGDAGMDIDTLQAEIEKVEEQMIDLIENNNLDCLVLVTHYAVNINIIDSPNR